MRGPLRLVPRRKFPSTYTGQYVFIHEYVLDLIILFRVNRIGTWKYLPTSHDSFIALIQYKRKSANNGKVVKKE